MRKTTTLKTFISTAILLLPFFLASGIQAEEVNLSVTGNGNASSNEVTTNSNNNTAVEQSNNATVNNEIDVSQNTGGNQANDNIGESTSIETGNVYSNSSITNENINLNSATNGGCTACGNPNGSVEISGNGNNSYNNANAIFNSQTTLSQNNTANITNSIYTDANTGKNSANNNLGNVKIKTGDITSIATFLNRNINISLANLPHNKDGELKIKILGNAANSTNTISVLYNNDFNYFANNFANITNKDIQHLNTGHNHADDNLGDVSIKTGDIVAIKTIINENINVNVLTPSADGVLPPVGGNPENPASNPPKNDGGGSVGGSSTSGGSTAGTSIGEILPITGSYWLYIITLASLIFFFAGWYLRFRSGQAPGRLALATA